MNTSEIQKMTEEIAKAMSRTVAGVTTEKFWVTHYGSNHIHPRYLAYWICVQTDTEKLRLSNDRELNQGLRRLLSVYKYPTEGIEEVHIGFESQECVDRDSEGNWWLHWKS